MIQGDLQSRLRKDRDTQSDDDDHSSNPSTTRATKRLRYEERADAPTSVVSLEHEHADRVSLPRARSEIPDSDASEDEDEDLPIHRRPTELESALPPVDTSKAAIAQYESSQPSGGVRKVYRSSIYVDAFNLALETTLQDESYLFNEAEIEVFNCWRQLEYDAKYLYVRLFLRKTSAWHRVSRLAYHSDIADLSNAIESLLAVRPLPTPSKSSEISYGLAPPEDNILTSEFTFATSSDKCITTLEEASSLLSLDELKTLAKEAKVVGKNKADLLKAFRRSSRQQTSLAWAGLKRTQSEDSKGSENGSRSPEKRSRPNTPSLERLDSVNSNVSSSDSAYGDDDRNRDSYYIRKIIAITGQCIRLSLAPLKLFERVHLVFYRSTEWTEKSLTTIILSKISRRNFPSYIVSRSANIFPTRSDLLEFEAAIRAQDRVDVILERSGFVNRAMLDEVLEIYENLAPRWRALLEVERQKEERVYDSGEGAYLRRFSPAWVYTRIAHKATAVFGKLKQYDQEYDLLTTLLEQHLFHLARRGSWYQRKALLEEHYMYLTRPQPDITDPEKLRKYWKRQALLTCEQGLQDKDCHVIFHYDLQKRIQKLERSLKVVKREQHDFGHARLCEPIERSIQGIKVEYDTGLTKKANEPAKSTRTIWIDEREGGLECTVEEMCLSTYRELGYKGYHCEGGLLRTIFAYLFYDIFFLYVPNVFQTEFQACPLDLHTDGFFSARASEINRRLADIANGDAPRLIQEVYTREKDQETCVVGLRWDYTLEDLLEIVTCFDGGALATICKVFAQEYGQRGGGIPDLFLWNIEKKEVLFAEVKSENDRLSDTQRLWIHVLTGAGIKVELCNAVAKEVRKLSREK